MEDFDPDVPGAFLGRGMAWPPQEDPATGALKKAADEESVSNCIEFGLNTNYGDIPGNEPMGTDLDMLLFRADLLDVADFVGDSFKRLIRTYEKRVFYTGGQFNLNNEAGGNRNRVGLVANLKYRIRATGQPDSRVYPFLLEKPKT